ncbi:PepSY-associated TM helix domain-containing protein [Gilvimarinus xylanilyticus]|uniref:PepSY domain-containing protein n=1 Tax=Gilvimarinus xylanilyticus TaxID=2944139 RepID=A0A9X2KST6_9GAMM|nr:PepSY domain-containing protein [Gilvimarinus xylanilyticus]
MRIEHFKVYNQIHTWAGIVAGLFLLVCFVTGAFTMFKEPLNQWALQSETTLPPIAKERYDELTQKVLAQHPEAQAGLTLYMPAAGKQNAPAGWVIENHDTHEVTQWYASLSPEGDLLTKQVTISAVGEFIDYIHQTAGIPGTIGHHHLGTYVMGVIAALYFVAIVSGLIIFLPSWFKDFLTVRKGKNRKRFWVDFHNVLGITALPFHIVIALTTFVFAYHDILYDSMRAMVYQDTPMFEMPRPRESQPELAELASIAQLTESIQALEPEFEPALVNYRGLNTPRASVFIAGDMAGHWVRGPYYAYVGSDPYTATPGYTTMLPNQPGVMSKVVNGFFALHFGGFGGNTIRWVYFGLGLSGALLFLTGNILWIETRRRRQKDPQTPVEQKKSTRNLARLTVGVCMGSMVGLALSLLAVKLVPHSEFDIQWWQHATYYFGFVLCVVWACVQAPMRAALQQMVVLITLVLALSAIGLMGFATINFAVSVVAFVIALGLMATWRWMRNRQALMGRDGVWNY